MLKMELEFRVELSLSYASIISTFAPMQRTASSSHVKFSQVDCRILVTASAYFDQVFDRAFRCLRPAGVII